MMRIVDIIYASAIHHFRDSAERLLQQRSDARPHQPCSPLRFRSKREPGLGVQHHPAFRGHRGRRVADHGADRARAGAVIAPDGFRRSSRRAGHTSGNGSSSRHLIPNVLGPIIVYTTLTIPSVMLLEAFLSFLGLGIQPPNASWGVLIGEGAKSMEEFPWLLIFPGFALSITLFSFNFLGDGLRDALGPACLKRLIGPRRNMRRPYYLGIRSLDLFVSALHDVDREVLRSLLAEAAAGKPHALDPRKVRLVEAEPLLRRKTARWCGDARGDRFAPGIDERADSTIDSHAPPRRRKPPHGLSHPQRGGARGQRREFPRRKRRNARHRRRERFGQIRHMLLIDGSDPPAARPHRIRHGDVRRHRPPALLEVATRRHPGQAHLDDFPGPDDLAQPLPARGRADHRTAPDPRRGQPRRTRSSARSRPCARSASTTAKTGCARTRTSSAAACASA